MRTMADMRREQDGAKGAGKGKGKGTEAYSGGEQSGMAVYQPGNSTGNDPWAVARAAGVVSDGGTSGAGPSVGGTVVTIYADGFTINDGPFRPLSDPANKKFWDDIHSGTSPEELKSADGSPVEVSVRDKRAEKYQTAAGVSSSSNSKRPIQPGQAADLSQGARAGPTATGTGEVIIDREKPVTTIMIRFGDGRRQTQEFNENASVGDLFAFVEACTGTGEFKLIEGFPPKPILDKTKTLKEARLLKGSITVKT